MEFALEVIGLYKSFGGLPVIRDVTLHLPVGARHALIGPNGAGKTTLVELLSGALRPDRGRIMIAGRDITRTSAQRRVKAGLVRSFQVTNLFRSLTVLENVYLASSEHGHASGTMFGLAARRRDLVERSEAILLELGLADDRHRPIRELAYGRQRLVEIAVVLALEPRVLLLDEPAAGIPSGEADGMLRAIEGLPRDIAILLIEHDMQIVRRMATEITVLVAGQILVTGAPDAVIRDAGVQSAYLGESGHERYAASGA